MLAYRIQRFAISAGCVAAGFGAWLTFVTTTGML
jgi:hypothetical protein